MFHLVFGDNGVTLQTPNARHLTAGITLMRDLFRLPLPLHKLCAILGRLVFLEPCQGINNATMHDAAKFRILFLFRTITILHGKFPDVDRGEIDVVVLEFVLYLSRILSLGE